MSELESFVRSTNVPVAEFNTNASYYYVPGHRGPYTGLLDLPGGKPEFGESPDHAVIREVQEELGLDALHPQLLYCDSTTYPYIHAEQEHTLHHIGMIYSCSVQSHSLKDSADGHDSRGAAWHSIDTIDKSHATPFVMNAIAHLRRGKQKH